MDDIVLKIDTGALIEVPIYEQDECGHNWLAIIVGRDHRAPGGLTRVFCEKAGTRGFYYLTDYLKRGQVIEFGADRVSEKRRNRKQPKRVYGVIQEVTADRLRFTAQPHVLMALAVAVSPAFDDVRKAEIKPIRKFPIDTLL